MGVVSASYYLLLCIEHKQTQYRPEHLFLYHSHIVSAASQDGGGDVETTLERGEDNQSRNNCYLSRAIENNYDKSDTVISTYS